MYSRSCQQVNLVANDQNNLFIRIGNLSIIFKRNIYRYIENYCKMITRIIFFKRYKFVSPSGKNESR